MSLGLDFVFKSKRILFVLWKEYQPTNTPVPLKLIKQYLMEKYTRNTFKCMSVSSVCLHYSITTKLAAENVHTISNIVI